MQHILKPLLRHPSMPLLVVLQVALACAIACNALFLLQQKLAPLLAPDGIGDPGHLIVVSGLAAHGKPWAAARLRAVEAGLRVLPGVDSVSYAATFPMISTGLMVANAVGAGEHTKANTVVYVGDHLVRALKLRLVAGRDFTAGEEGATLDGGMGFHTAGPVIITRALADRLFPGEHALGRQIVYESTSAAPRTVVGVVAHLMRNQLGQGSRTELDYSMLFPGVPAQWPAPRFAVRARTAGGVASLRKAVMGVVQRELGSDMLPGATPSVEMYSTARANMLAGSRAAVWLLAGVTLIVLIVTLTGIMGMTGYWVRQRTKQIGIRRALGARRGDILRAFQIENLLVVGVGVLLGVVAAYAINVWLMQHYELSRLPWNYLPVGAVIFLVLGQLVVLVPARRATHIAPVVATRTV